MLAPTSGLAREKGRGRRTEGEDGGALEGKPRVKGSKTRASCHLEMMRRKIKATTFTYLGHKTLYHFLQSIPFSFYAISQHFFFLAHQFF